MSDKFEKFSDPGRAAPKPEKKQSVAPAAARFSTVAVARLVALVIAGALCALMIHQVHRIEVVENQQDQLAKLTTQRAQITVTNVANYLKQLHSALEQFAAKPLLEKALKEKDTASLEQFAQMLSEQVPHTVKVRFFPLGTATRNTEVFPPIRFAELELIRFAEHRQPTRVEAARFDDRWLITLVSPVPVVADAPVVGSMMLSVDAEGLREVLEQNNAGMGEVSLMQNFGKGKPQLVAQLPGDSISDPYEVTIPATPWKISFAPSNRLAQQTHINIPLILGILGAVSLGLLAVALWVGSFIGKRIVIAQRTSPKGAWQTLAAVATARDEPQPGSVFHKTDILDVDIAAGDEKLLGLHEDQKRSRPQRPVAGSMPKDEEDTVSIPDHVFRAYDIRGKFGTDITKEFAHRLGQALGSEALDAGEATLIVARDARNHSPQLTEFLTRGILSTGCNVLNIGTVPTPLLYFATETLDESSSGVMVTASHNPGDQNGFKIVINGQCRSQQDIKAIRSRILSGNVYQGKGHESRHDVVPAYVDTIFSDVALAGDVSIVIDAANAVPGMVAPRLFEELGCMVTPLFCDLDGNFPNHSPDPSIEANLAALKAKVRETGADLGVAFDGDGDRLAVVTPKGKVIWPDRLLMLFARDIVSRNPGADVVFDVKSTRHLNTCIAAAGGRPIMWKTGHSPMKHKMAETGALLGGEYSGHIFIKDRWYGFDDGLYAAARLIEIISLQGQSLDDIFAEFEESPCTPEIRVDVGEEKKFELVQKLVETGNFGDGKITTLDGLRVDYSNGWGLVRASNTSAHLTMRFEADDQNALHQLKSLFVRELRAIDSSINVNWDQQA